MAMKQMVVTRAMPPWFEDGHTEKFENNRSLTQAQIDTIAAWVDAGAPKGDPKDMPPPLDFVKGWTIPSPTRSSSCLDRSPSLRPESWNTST
jgi:hypothetical protein